MENISDSTQKNKVALLSLLATGVLVVLKIIIAFSTGSLSILSEALDSVLDIVASLMTCVAVWLSSKPADDNHNFGHGKVENLSALLETSLVLITCFWIVKEAIFRLINNDVSIDVGFWSFAVIILSIFVNIWRAIALYRVAKKCKSQALEAGALNFFSDILRSVVVIIGLICVKFNIFAADAIAALVVALIVIYLSIKLFKKALDVLLDKAPEDVRNHIVEILKSIDDVKHFHDLKVRSSGCSYQIEVCIHVKPTLTVAEAHDIAEVAEDKIKEQIDNVAINVHIEPHNT